GPFEFGTSYDSSGCSKVRFHPTDAPGDNFRVTALMKTKIGDRSVVSKAMTVWKRLHVELDSMGQVEGFIEPDDAVIGDVPDPLPDFLSTAFAAAYIEIIPTGPGMTTDVTFDQYVPDISTVNAVPQIAAQGALGRESLHVSEPGNWWVYAQGG